MDQLPDELIQRIILQQIILLIGNKKNEKFKLLIDSIELVN